MITLTHTQIVMTVINPLMLQLATRFGLSSFESETAFEADKGSPAADGDRYFDTSFGRIRIFGGGQWHTVGGSLPQQAING